MFNVSNNNISLTRGDTVILNLDIQNYELQDSDDVVLTVKKNVNTPTIILQKKLDFENMRFVIKPDDTSKIPYGTYKYDVQITTSEGNVYTIITPHDFILDGEITW